MAYNKKNAEGDDVGYNSRLSYLHYTLIYKTWCLLNTLTDKLYRYGQRIGAIR